MKKIAGIFVFAGMITTSTFSQYFDYALQIGATSSGSENSLCVVTDASDNVYNFGFFSEITDFDPGPAVAYDTALVTQGFYMQKLDSLGNLIWYRTLLGPSLGGFQKNGNGAAVDAAGNILITGYYIGTVDFDPSSAVYNVYGLLGEMNAFVAKYDNMGNLVWAQGFVGGTNHSVGHDVTTDAAGNVYLTGAFSHTVDFDGGSGTYFLTAPGTIDQADAYFVKLDNAGNLVFAKQIGGPSVDVGLSIDLDAANNILVSGYHLGNIDADPGAGTFNLIGTAGGTSGFVLKLDNAGNFIWADGFTCTDQMNLFDIDLDASGNIYACGSFRATVDFDPGAGTFLITPSGPEDAFILKLDALTGALDFVKTIGNSNLLHYHSIVASASGTFYASGNFYDTLDCDPGPGIYNISAAAGHASFVQRFDVSGNMEWTVTGAGQICTITDDTHNAIYASGTFGGVTDFDAGPAYFNMDSQSNSDGYIFKLGQDQCSALTGLFNPSVDPSCSSSGFVETYTINGVAPFVYYWDVLPIDNDSILNPTIAGIYTIHITDSAGCTDEKTILVNGTTSTTGFDLNANMVAGTFRPGFLTTVILEGFNNGCVPVSGNMYFVLDSMVSYVSSGTPPDLISGDTLIWNFSGFSFGSGSLNPTITVQTSALASIGDLVCFDLIIDPVTGDSIPANNTKNYCKVVTGSYDPNLKSVYPQGVCDENYITPNQRMTYTVMFQNTGNDTAFNIVLHDKIDDLLDLSSLSVIASSHPVITEIEPVNNVKFKFNNIYLPDSTTNEPASHGYVIYEINQLPALPDGSVIDNTVAIYFDFNAPIYTNTVMNTIVSVLPSCATGTGIAENASSEFIKVYPNPTNESITISTEKIIAQKISLVDVYGRTIKTVQPNSSQTILDLQNLDNGIYFITVSSENSQQTVKIVKQ